MKGCIGMHCLWPAGEPVSNCRLSPSPVFVKGSRIVMAPSGGARSRGGGGAGRGRKGEPRGPGPPRCPGDGDGWTEVSEGQGAEGMGEGRQVLEPSWPWCPRHTPGKPPEPRSHCAGRALNWPPWVLEQSPHSVLREAWGQRTKALTRLRPRPARSHSRAKGEDWRRDGLPDGAPGETPACGWEALRCGFGAPAVIPHPFAVPRISYRGSDTTPRARQVTRLPLASGR